MLFFDSEGIGVYKAAVRYNVQCFAQDDVQYGVNLDVTSYTNGKRETHNPPGRALPYTVWDFYEVQIMNIYLIH